MIIPSGIDTAPLPWLHHKCSLPPRKGFPAAWLVFPVDVHFTSWRKREEGGLEKQTEAGLFIDRRWYHKKNGKQVSTEKNSWPFSLKFQVRELNQDSIFLSQLSYRSYEVTCLLATEACVPHNINPIKWFYRCCCTVNIAVKTSRRTLWERWWLPFLPWATHTSQGKRTMEKRRHFLNNVEDMRCTWWDLLASLLPVWIHDCKQVLK